jgi:ERCC4-type nuclease|tara:strand:- start:548 stop:1252 length:705 start_codon:yes stop_codon:yes gene_type:complete
MARVIVDAHEHGRIKAMAEMILNAEVEPLEVGDFRVEGEGFEEQPIAVVVERKTWSDAYGSFNSKRLQNQISRLIEAAVDSNVRPVLLVEGSTRDIYGVNADRIRALQQHLNRLSVESVPVVYTESIDETFRYLNSVVHRVKSKEFGSLVRPVTVVTSSRNKHHAMLEQMPKVGRTMGKKIYDEYASLVDFVNRFESDPVIGSHTKAYQAIVDFINTEWGEAKSETITKLEASE